MKTFRFLHEKYLNSYSIYTLIAVALSIFIFIGLNIYISKAFAYLLVSILSFCSIMTAVRKASREFEEIVINEGNIKFYFQNKMKEPLSIAKSEISIVIVDDSIVFTNIKSGKLIGKAYKIKLEQGYDWEELLKCIKF